VRPHSPRVHHSPGSNRTFAEIFDTNYVDSTVSWVCDGLANSCSFAGNLVGKIKGPDNPTCQLLPTSRKTKVKMAWGKQERQKRDGAGLGWSKLCVEE
jgi:hypothetical protein